jgi:hypothetical protein
MNEAGSDQSFKLELYLGDDFSQGIFMFEMLFNFKTESILSNFVFFKIEGTTVEQSSPFTIRAFIR